MTGTDKWFRIRQETVEAERLRRERRTREESLKKGTPQMGDPLEDLARMNATCPRCSEEPRIPAELMLMLRQQGMPESIRELKQIVLWIRIRLEEESRLQEAALFEKDPEE